MAFEAMTSGAAGAGTDIADTTTASFRQDVLVESTKRVVLVDFWAPWCGPCKQLTPVLEKVVKAAAGKVKLLKMNIDEHPQIAGQLGIQSIPAVIAFRNGQPVDGFMGALPEGQVKAFIEKLTGPVGPGPIEELLAEADGLLAQGDVATAADVYTEVLQHEPTNLKAIAALAKVHVELGDLEGARSFLAMAPADKADDPALAGARAALELADQAASVGDFAALEQTVATEPANHQARFDLALALAGAGQREPATYHLIEIIKRDRTWNDDGARKQLLQFFEAWGPMDEHSVAGRRKLSAVLFR